MNLAQLRTQIDRRTGVRQDPLAANSYINEALNVITSRREWPWIDAVQTIATTVDEDTYAVPSNYSESRAVTVNGVEAVMIYVADGDEFFSNRLYVPSRYEYTIEWNAGSAELRFFPTPPEGTVVTHRYTRTEGLLSNDTDSPLLPERYHTVLCDLATALFLERINPGRSDFYNTRAEKGLKQMGEAVQRKTNPGRIRIRDWFPY